VSPRENQERACLQFIVHITLIKQFMSNNYVDHIGEEVLECLDGEVETGLLHRTSKIKHKYTIS
jgi:hypothetical protein